MTYSIAAAEWDSRFFGFPIGNMEVPGTYSPEMLAETLRAAHTQYRLVTVSIRAECPDTLTIADYVCPCYVRQLSFKKDVQKSTVPVDANIKAYTSTFCSPALERLAIQSGMMTRFRQDPELSPYFEQLFLAWINFAVSKELADSIWTWYENGQHLGLVTIRSAKRLSPQTGQLEKEGRIGMLAVDSQHRRKGIGSRLFDVCEYWCSSLSIPVAAIVTQKDNEPVISLCRQFGFRQDHEDSVYHYWSPGWVYDTRRGWIVRE
ncbi:MAG: GNAT family N-acetyltransferase [Planctomycetaceae bacterium]|jgi:GNAT superfamily N-acetyltransferase|nr:GNAT family N-acetyltransferase [Planctomycetaceae bacterium]